MKSFFQNLKKNLILSLGILIVICIGVVIIGLNTPGKRFTRAMANAEKAYTKGDFAKAAAGYEKAIGIKSKNKKVTAYTGLISSKEAEGAEDLKETYLEGLTAIEAMNENDRYVVLDAIIEYVLHDSVVFTDDVKERIDALERAYDLTYGDTNVAMELSECVSGYIETLRLSEEYDTALEYVERFKEKTDIDADALTKKLTKEKEFAAEKDGLLKNVYEALKGFVADYSAGKGTDPYSYDFAKILAIDGSASAETVAGAFISGSYQTVFEKESEDDGLNGKGAGLYTFGDRYRTEKGGVAIPYYFYVGDYKDGVRSGFGVSFMKVGVDSFFMYAGEWSNDLPSGKGARYEKIVDSEGESSYTKTYDGTWKDGLAEGAITIAVTEESWPDVVFSGIMTAKAGVCDEVPTETEDYVVINLREGKLVGVLASSTEGYALMITIWQGEDETVSALGLN